MRRYILKLMVALMTFCIGVAAVVLWPAAIRHKVELSKIQVDENSVTTIENFTFVNGMHATSKLGCESLSSYRAWADGSLVSSSTMHYKSSAQATRALRQEVKEAEQIVERTVVRDQSGNQVGERVVVRRRPNTRALMCASILWTWDNRYCSINAESLQRALEFEKSGQR